MTPGLLLLMTGFYFALLLRAPFWLVFIPCVMLAHRIGVMLHEFVHGIPFRAYRANHNIVTIFDGLLLMFGTMEVFRATHLAHHRWLNTDLDPAWDSDRRSRGRGIGATLKALEGFQFLGYLLDTIAGRKPYVVRSRIVIGCCLSALTIVFWHEIGLSAMPWKMLTINAFTTLVPVSLRGAVEHYSGQDDPGFANEYRVWFPLFNLNRHIHHHENPTLPWYRLQFRTANPLSNRHYFTHWFRVYLTRELRLMHPRPPRAGGPPE